MSLHFGIRLHFRANKLVQFARVHVSLHFLIGILCIFCMQCVALLGALLGAAFPNENVRRGPVPVSQTVSVHTLRHAVCAPARREFGLQLRPRQRSVVKAVYSPGGVGEGQAGRQPKLCRARSRLYRSAVSTPIFASKELLRSLTTFDKIENFRDSDDRLQYSSEWWEGMQKIYRTS